MRLLSRLLLTAALVPCGLAVPAFAQQPAVPAADLGPVASTVSGLQFGLLPGSIGSPSGTMSGYSAGSTITLACPGLTFTTAPVVGVTAVTGGVPTSTAVLVPGVTTGAVPAGTVTCSQASVVGGGTGYTVTASLGVIAAYLSVPGLATGGSGAANGNLSINYSGIDGTFTAAGPENTFFGAKAGLGMIGASGYNAAFGHNACGSGGTPVASNNNTCVGDDAGRNTQNGTGGNTLIGAGAGRNIAGAGAVMIGYQAGGTGGSNTPGALSGNYNIIVGYLAGNTVSSGVGNILFGARGGSAITTGQGDIILAANTGSTDSCANGNESNVVAFCAGAGRVFTITGGATPSTSNVALPGTLSVGGLSMLPNFSATTGNLGGSALAAGACSSVTVAITGLTTAMDVHATPATYPGDGTWWEAYASAAGTATVKVCSSVGGTPTASAYNVRVFQ